MRVEVKVSAFPLLSDRHPEFITFLAVRMFPLTPPLHVPQFHDNHAAIPYDATYHLAVVMTNTIQQIAAQLMTALPLPHYQGIPQVVCSHHQLKPTTPSMMTSRM